MKTIQRIRWLFVPLILILASNQSWAIPPFPIEGSVYQIDNKYINVNDRQYLISPTVKVYSVDKKIISLSDIILNDLVSISFLWLGNKKMVDQIYKIDALSESLIPPNER